MNRKKVRIVAAVVALVLAFSFIFAFVADIVVNMYADAAESVSSLNQKLSNLDKERQKIKKELNAIEKKKQSTMTKKAALDDQIDVTEKEIDTINLLIAALDEDIAVTEKELQDAEAKEQKQTEEFLKRVRVMEEAGNASMLGIILSADSFSDMITRTELVGDVVASDKQFMHELKETREGIAQKKATLDESKKAQVEAKKSLVAKEKSLNQQYNDANALVKELTAEEKEYERRLNEADAAMAATRNSLQKLLSNSSNSTYVGGEFRWPTDATRITSPYGTRNDPITKKRTMHTGVDIGAGMGKNIYAANSGKVVVAGWSSKGYGNYVVIDHGGGKSTLYAHMSKIKTSQGATVSKGDVIGLVGSTGYSTGPHLHFEILINGKHTNPMAYFNK